LFLNKEKQNLEIKTLNADLGEYSAKFPAQIKGDSLNLTLIASICLTDWKISKPMKFR